MGFSFFFWYCHQPVPAFREVKWSWWGQRICKATVEISGRKLCEVCTSGRGTWGQAEGGQASGGSGAHCASHETWIQGWTVRFLKIWRCSCTPQRSPGPIGPRLGPPGLPVAPEQQSEGMESGTTLPSLILSLRHRTGEKEERLTRGRKSFSKRIQEL